MEGSNIDKDMRINEKQIHYCKKDDIVYDTIPLPFQILNMQGYLENVNSRLIKVLGYNREELIGAWFGDFLHTDDREKFKKFFLTLEQTGFVQGVELRIKHKDGHYLDASFNGTANITMDDIVKVYCVFQDISNRKMIEKTLKNERENLKNVIEGTRAGTWQWNVQTGKTVFNQRWAEIVGYSLEELSPTNVNTWKDLTHPKDLQKSYKLLQRHFSGESPYYDFQCRMKHKNGQWIWIHDRGCVVSWTNDGEPLMMCGTHVDITKQKKAEEALRESERFLNNVFDGIQDGISVLDSNFNIIKVNEWMKKKYTHKMPLIGKKCYEMYQDRESICPWCPSVEAFKKKEKKTSEVPYPDEKNPEGWISLSSYPFKNKYGEVTGIIETVKDISYSKKAEEALRKSEERLNLAMSVTNDGIWDWNLITNEVYFDPRYYMMSGYDPDEFPYRLEEFQKRVHPDDITMVMNHAEKHLNGEIDRFKVEFRFKKKNGLWMWILGKGKIVEKDSEGKPIRFVGTHSDITERKNAEHDLKSLNEQLERIVTERTNEIQRLLQQKDEFINQLSHDLKNPLGPFVHLLPILKNHVSGKKEKQMVDVLLRNTQYMQNLVKKTIDLAKLNSSKTKFTFEDVSLDDLVNEVILVNTHFFDDHDVIVENNISSDFLVHVDPIHIEEVFTNLFNNAVKYSNEDRWIGIDMVEKNDYVVISVHDKGIGISEDQLPYLFYEYYKADSSRHDFDSSGLGLPICKRIIEKHGGKIWAESPGPG
ncbi:MAG: PAS domain-containing protein, partial [Candidatus Thermoplasmatota archaeon]|nr:PAS domain-containing protein [Candidatus Thermoplasmatota archaeon]